VKSVDSIQYAMEKELGYESATCLIVASVNLIDLAVVQIVLGIQTATVVE